MAFTLPPFGCEHAMTAEKVITVGGCSVCEECYLKRLKDFGLID